MKCYFCGAPLRWESDFSFEDFGIADEEGIVSNYNCDSCNAWYEIWKPESEGERNEHQSL